MDGFREFILAEGLFTTHSMILFILTLVIPTTVTILFSLVLHPIEKCDDELLEVTPLSKRSRVSTTTSYIAKWKKGQRIVHIVLINHNILIKIQNAQNQSLLLHNRILKYLRKKPI